MPLVLDATYFTSSPITGTSASLAIQVPSTDKRILVVALVSNFTSGFGSDVASINYAGFAFSGTIVESIGCALYFMRDPLHTPGITTKNINVTFNSSRICGICAYLISIASTSFPFGQVGLDASTSGDPVFSGNFTLTDKQILITAVRSNENTLLPNQVNQVMNITSGSGSSLVTYASGYYQASGNETVDGGWTRQATPVNASWGIVGRVAITGEFNPRIVAS